MEMSSNISLYSSCTIGEFRSPSPWYLACIELVSRSTRIRHQLAMTSNASSCRSFAISQRGVSGRNGEPRTTNPENIIWNHTGILQDIVPGIPSVPAGIKVPGMPPMNQKQLNIPVITPLYAGWAISDTYDGPAADVIATPKPRMNRPHINCARP
jgi:hypothetical protein